MPTSLLELSDTLSGKKPALTLPSKTPIAPAQSMRAFGDATATRQLIFDNVLHAAKTLPVMENRRHTLSLQGVSYRGSQRFSVAERKKAILSGRSLGRKLHGTWVLRNKETGDELDRREMTIARVPYLTDAGTFVHNGNEYTLSNQLRLRAGNYTRIKDNGEIEAHANIMPGKGRAHRYFLDPEKGIFYMRVGQAKIPLVGLLKVLGADDNILRNAWGQDLFAANGRQDTEADIQKFYDKLVSRKPVEGGATSQQRAEFLRQAIEKMEVDPEVSQRTLGQNFRNMSLDSILAITKKLIAVGRGEAEVDDRDHLAYQTVHGPEDLFAERLSKDYSGSRRTMFNRASWAGNLQKFQPGALTKQLESALLHSGLGMALEEINPADVFDKQFRVSRLGEGGIPSIDAVPREARSVQPSHFGFLDPIRTPECLVPEMEVMTRVGWKRADAITKEDILACLLHNRLEWHHPENLHRYRYEGLIYGAETSRLAYEVTGNHRMWVMPYDMKQTFWRIETAEVVSGKRRRFMCGGHEPSQGKDTGFRLPEVKIPGRSRHTNRQDVLMSRDWAEFLGWWLAEGCIAGETTVVISKTRAKTDEWDAIADVIERLGYEFRYSGHNFHINDRQLAQYLKQFGKAGTKYVPDYIFDYDEITRQTFLDAIFADARKGNTEQFCSTSKQLADGVQVLLFSLGQSTRTVFEPDARPEYDGCWVVHVHKCQQRVLLANKRKWDTGEAISDHYTRDYSGYVYCVTVPGNLIYVRYKEKTGFWCGNSFKVGVDVYLSSASKKGQDGRIYSPFIDSKTGDSVWRSPQDVADLAIAFPGEMSRDTKRVFAMQKGRIRAVPKTDIDLVLPHFENAFSPLANMVPLKSMVKGQRMAMASRMMTQALPLLNPESPLVQSGAPGGRSYEDGYGRHMGAVRATRAGRVISVDSSKIVVLYSDGKKETHELYENFPYNRKTYIHQTPTVRAGQTFGPGELLARSNYTDAKGVTALGKNARVAYVPFRGMNFEDAVVISEGFAKRLTSEHMYQHKAEFDATHKRTKRDFIALFPTKFNRAQLDTLDADGAIAPGTTVNFGDPLVLAAAPRSAGQHKVHRKKARAYEDGSFTWNHHSPGTVTDVIKTKTGTTVLVKSESPMQIGDKLSGRYGDKGIISAIIPDKDMPHDRDDRPFEVLLNPLGILTRTNPAQLIEAVLGKIAAKRGKPYIISDFEDVEDMTEWALRELQQADMTDTENIIDPETGRRIDGILTGNRFFMKLHHTAEGKGQGRSTGGYTMEGLPAKGGEAGSKRISVMDTNALLSHGATEVLRDAAAVRGQRNEDYWLAFMQGHSPPEPQIPLVFKKFVNELKGAGINVVSDGGQLHIMALTDSDVSELAGDREVTNGGTVDFNKDMAPIKGGLFDPKLTGGHQGNRWGYIKLQEPMPNPVMEEPIRRILGLTQKKFNDVIACKDNLGGGECGPEAIKSALDSINLNREILRARVEMKGDRKGARDAAVRRLGYFKAAKRLGIHPREWMMSKVPVLPPIFRPISMIEESEIPIVSDANYLYKELIEANDLLRDMKKEVTDVGEERLALYGAFKAVTGLGDPVHPKLQEKNIKGLLKHIFGSSPKVGTVQRRLISSPVDLVGRAVISPNPDLDMDHVGLPESRAWDVYRNFIIRRLRRKGLPLMEAMKQAEERSPNAREELLKEMEERPVFINRAPVLHRFGVMAFWPRLVKGDVLQVSPLIVKGFNADFDGDAMQYHVPVDENAKKEAIELMMPSRNLLSPANFSTPMHMPSQEYVGGLFAATRRKKGKKTRPHYFASSKDAIEAYRRGEIPIDANVKIKS